MDKKALLTLLSLGTLALAAGGCTDAGYPVLPRGQTANATVTVVDLVGDWDQLFLVGDDLTGAEAVALVRDGYHWTATVTNLQPGTYPFAIAADVPTKDLVPIVADLELVVGDDYQVSGDQTVVIPPAAGRGFNLTVVNHDPAYDNIKIKGAMNEWAADLTGHSADLVHWYLHVPGGLAAGSYEWGVIEDDGSEFGIWLLPPGPNLQFTVAEDGAVSGDLQFVIEEPEPNTQLTLNVDMSGVEGEITVVGVSGTFDNWADPPTTILTDPDEDGVYSVTIDVEQNQEVRFKFRLNGAWENVPAACGVNDGLGGNNRVLEIGATPVTFTAPWQGCPE